MQIFLHVVAVREISELIQRDIPLCNAAAKLEFGANNFAETAAVTKLMKGQKLILEALKNLKTVQAKHGSTVSALSDKQSLIANNMTQILHCSPSNHQ